MCHPLCRKSDSWHVNISFWLWKLVKLYSHKFFENIYLIRAFSFVQVVTEMASQKQFFRVIFTLILVTVVLTQRIANYNQVGKTFIDSYYKNFDGDQRTLLKDVYDNFDSYVVFRGEVMMGADKIIERFNTLPRVAQRNISFTDFQPTSDSGVILNVFGKIMFNDPLNNSTLFFSEMIVLKLKVTAYYVQNQYFRSSGMYNNTDGLHFV